MKNQIIAAFIFLAPLLYAQNVYLTKVEKTNSSKDAFLYAISKEIGDAEYLGEVEIQGFSKNESETFSLIYKKAKEIGANSFAVKPVETIEGNISNFDASHYSLKLYYLPKEQFSAQQGNLYLFASSHKNQKISINRKDEVLSPRTYLEVPLSAGEIYTISTKKILGSTIKVERSAKGSDQYYQISAARLGNSAQNDGTLHLKSGDIIGIERSYADFLKVIYKKSE